MFALLQSARSLHSHRRPKGAKFIAAPGLELVSVGDSAELVQSVAMTVRGSTEVDVNDIGMRDYLVIKGTATVTEGGAPELLHRLATTERG
jgi:hypothetical protein